MSRKYKFHNQQGLYFVCFATVSWIPVFIRETYFNALVETLTYCQENKGMDLYCFCIMPNHVHLIFQAEDGKPVELLQVFKTYTARLMIRLIQNNIQKAEENGCWN